VGDSVARPARSSCSRREPERVFSASPLLIPSLQRLPSRELTRRPLACLCVETVGCSSHRSCCRYGERDVHNRGRKWGNVEVPRPRPRIAMRKIRDLLRLVVGQGLSRRQATAATGVPCTTEADCQSAPRSGLLWDRSRNPPCPRGHRRSDNLSRVGSPGHLRRTRRPVACCTHGAWLSSWLWRPSRHAPCPTTRGARSGRADRPRFLVARASRSRRKRHCPSLGAPAAAGAKSQSFPGSEASDVARIQIGISACRRAGGAWNRDGRPPDLCAGSDTGGTTRSGQGRRTGSGGVERSALVASGLDLGPTCAGPRGGTRCSTSW